MKGKHGTAESRAAVDALVITCGVGCLFTFNVLLCVMLSFVRFRFNGDLKISDDGMLACQITSLLVTALLTFIRSTDILFTGMVLGAVCNAVGTGLVMISNSKGIFVTALAIIGCGMSFIQGCGFAVLAHPTLETYSGPPKFSLGQGLGGLAAWSLGVVFDRVFKEPSEEAMPVNAACCILFVASCFTVVPSCWFVAFFRPKVLPATSDGPASTLPNSREPLYPTETVQGPTSEDYIESTDDSGLAPIVPYVLGIYIAFMVTLFCFPGVAPLRWNIGDKVIWLIGVFQVADITGRFLGGWTPRMSSALFVGLSIIRLPLLYWCLVALRLGLAAKVVCMATLAASNSYLFTVGMSQSPSKITPHLRASAASSCILGLLLGNATGLWACGRFADRLIQLVN